MITGDAYRVYSNLRTKLVLILLFVENCTKSNDSNSNIYYLEMVRVNVEQRYHWESTKPIIRQMHNTFIIKRYY